MMRCAVSRWSGVEEFIVWAAWVDGLLVLRIELTGRIGLTGR